MVARGDLPLPHDSLSESRIINFAATYPQRLLDLGLVPDDFYDRNHRRIWHAMVNTRLEQPHEVSPGAFYLSVTDRLASSAQHDPESILKSVDLAADWRAYAPGAPTRQVDHFVSEIRRCVQARRLIEAAQEIAERSYAVPNQCFDVTDASVVLSRAAGAETIRRIGIELPI
jgi:replicative DNA helicase